MITHILRKYYQLINQMLKICTLIRGPQKINAVHKIKSSKSENAKSELATIAYALNVCEQQLHQLSTGHFELSFTS